MFSPPSRYDIAERLLLYECCVNSRDCYGDTALMLAARRGHTRLVTLMLSHGCPHDACSDELDTALHYAARYVIRQRHTSKVGKFWTGCYRNFQP